MPEAPEIRLFRDFNNKFSTFPVIRIETKKNDSFDFKSGTMLWESRGKEMKCTIQDLSIYFSLGFASWSFINREHNIDEKILRNIVFSFYFDNHKSLSLIDTRRFAKWKCKDDWERKSRGPCPFEDSLIYKKNIIDNINKSDFNKPIYETLMNQKYFSGVGNYLRAVILNRSKGDYNQNSRDFLIQNGQKFLDLVLEVIHESYSLQKQGKMKDSWYYPYQSGNSFKDKNGRTFWYS